MTRKEAKARLVTGYLQREYEAQCLERVDFRECITIRNGPKINPIPFPKDILNTYLKRLNENYGTKYECK